MLDQIWGRPSTSYKRTQVVIVLLFWLHQLVRNKDGPPVVRRWSSRLSRFTPYQLVVGTLALVYAFKHSDDLLGLSAPEPLARLYSRDYYRATWIVTALDAGFATAMNIAWKPLRDVMSILFTLFYLVRARAADEKLRRYRAECSIDMLRTTWEKTTNPIIRFLSRPDRPKVTINKIIYLKRPASSQYSKSIKVYLYFDGTPEELAQCSELVLDIPGGGFVAMNPQHHEEYLLRWAKQLRRPVLAVEYCKAPEYPYPYAVDECLDLYKLLYETQGQCIGMKGSSLSVVVCGDSAGANIASVLVISLIENKAREPLPVALVFAYPALSFHFTSWLPNEDLGVLRQESFSSVKALLKDKDTFEHRSPLSVVDEEYDERTTGRSKWSLGLRSDSPTSPRLRERVIWEEQKARAANQQQQSDNEPAYEPGTRLAMTSRAAFVNDRILSPSMCRAMAVLYIGPKNAPDLHNDYRISPIFAPADVLAKFPPMYMCCGERDPFVDDTVIFAGRLREAKEARKAEALGKTVKFGESLRMSSSISRDPIIDETEEDWANIKIIEGWSHGYLQMIALLPKVKHTISMMGDWIELGFAKGRKGTKPAQPKPSAAAAHVDPGRTAATTVRPPTLVINPASESSDTSDKEEEVLTFTPKKRRSSSNASSATASPTRAVHSSPFESPRPRAARRSDSSSSSSGADELATKQQPPHRPRRSSGSTHRPSSSSSSANGGEQQSTQTLFRSVTDPLSKGASGAVTDASDVPEALLARLKAAGATSDSHFVDTREILSRRRREAVQGISGAATPSVNASDDDNNK